LEKNFNLRIYGILINSDNEVLLSDEKHCDLEFTKFPGGGLEWGEGTKETLIREFQEELNLDIEVGELFYCTDYFQQSAFSKNDQLISIYYLISCKDYCKIPIQETEIHTKGKEHHRWMPLNKISEEIFSLPIDKIVAQKLKELL
jgi:ADP-ribose pyrophosphatase YjhB (NUDIX family)